MRRKYDNPADALLARKKPKTEEHKQKIREANKRFWEKAKQELAEREKKENPIPIE